MDQRPIGGGLQLVQNGFFVGPVRDSKAPRSPCSLDISAGIREPGESVGHLQLREGTEEIIWIDHKTVSLPDVVQKYNILESAVSAIEKAMQDSKNPFNHEYRFYNSEVRVPTSIRKIKLSKDLEYKNKTGLTVGKFSRESYELVNYLLVNPPKDFSPIDTEVVEKENEENLWLDRIVYKFHPMTGEAYLYQSGEQIFYGNFKNMIARLEKELNQKPDFTCKVKASLEGLPIEDQKVYEEIDFDEGVNRFFDLSV